MSESPAAAAPTTEGQPSNAGRTVQGQSTGSGPDGEIVAGESVEAQTALAGRTVDGQATGVNRHPSRPVEQSERGARRHQRTGQYR